MIKMIQESDLRQIKILINIPNDLEASSVWNNFKYKSWTHKIFSIITLIMHFEIKLEDESAGWKTKLPGKVYKIDSLNTKLWI